MKYFKIFSIALLMIFLTSCTEDENYITSAVVNSEGHLVLTYSDGTTLDQGLVIPEVVDVEVFLVNFYNTENHIISTQVVDEGEDAFAPLLDLPDHMVFDEWDTVYLNVTSDLNVRPVWHEETFTISFHGTEVPIADMIGIGYGENIILPDPTVPGKEFLGWYDDDGPYATRLNMKTQIQADMNLYARYETIVYTLTMHIDGDIEVHTQEVLYGEMLGITSIPNFPTKENYFFNGWYSSPGEIGPLGSEIEITEDIDIYASWIQFEYSSNDLPSTPDDEYVVIKGVIGDHNYVHVPTMIDGYEVQRIGLQAFRYEPFYEVYLPDTINHLYDYAFADMPNLTSIVLPESLIYVGYAIFYNCTNLTDVILPPNLQSTGINMFQNTAIESIVIPDGYEYLAYGSFMDTPLTSISIPSSLIVFEDYSLANTSLSEFVIPEGVENIGAYAFKDCQYLTTVSIPQSINYIGTNPFAGASNLTTVTIHESNPNYELIDDVIYNETTTRIKVYLPYKTDTTFQVPATITNIDQNAFFGNPNLEILQLPDALINCYPDNNFQEMESLDTFEVYDAPGAANYASNNGVLYSDDYTYLFKYPVGKTDVAYAVHSSTIIIYGRAFKDNTHIVSVVLSNGLQTIYPYAFENCTNLSAINLPTTLSQIYDGVFHNVDGITSITLPDSVTYLGYGVFSDMDNLTSLTLNEGLTSLYGNLLANSNNVTSLHIPSTISSINTNTLVDANGITSLTIDPGNLNFNVYNSSIYSEDFTRLYCVAGGFNQESYYIRGETIYVYAHFGSNPNIKIIRVNSNVTSFQSYVRDLPNLQGIVFYNTNTVTALNIWPFDPNLDEGFNIYVPENLYDDYINNYNWIYFEEWIVPFT